MFGFAYLSKPTNDKVAVVAKNRQPHPDSNGPLGAAFEARERRPLRITIASEDRYQIGRNIIDRAPAAFALADDQAAVPRSVAQLVASELIARGFCPTALLDRLLLTTGLFAATRPCG